MAKKRKAKSARTTASRKARPYLPAKELGILPEEREALIAFVNSPSLGRIVEVDGHAHYYDQSDVNDRRQAEQHECGTAGCVAGFVFAHVTLVQKKSELRGEESPYDYISRAYETNDNLKQVTPFLDNLYTESGNYKLATAREVVRKALLTGDVTWPSEDGFSY